MKTPDRGYRSRLHLIVFAVVAILTKTASSVSTNIALRKPAKQSTTRPEGGAASRAVDGNKDTNFLEGQSCSHTNYRPKDWWRVDLLDIYFVHTVGITNRQHPEYHKTLTNFDIRVSSRSELSSSAPLCHHFGGTVGAGVTQWISCDKAVYGRYLFIQHLGTQPLVMCEVEVHGSLVSMKTNIAYGKLATQSSTRKLGGAASRAVDGDKHTNFEAGKSCSHTIDGSKDWWRVDLENVYAVHTVAITNREHPTYHKTLTNFDIRLSTNSELSSSAPLCHHFGGTVGAGITEWINCDKPVYGRYLFIQQLGNQYLVMCEVEVFGKLSPNIAFYKFAYQSSTGLGAARRAVDGNKNPNMLGGQSCSHTLSRSKDWWSVDLENVYAVHIVAITNRDDPEFYKTLTNFDIRLSSDNKTSSSDPLCRHFGGTVGAGVTQWINCDKAVYGRYLFIQQLGTQPLVMCEVEVYGTLITMSANIALHKPTKQSSTRIEWVDSSRAVDGNKNTDLEAGRSCSHTFGRNNDWWRVDLEKVYAVHTVAITNRRHELYYATLTNFDIRVSGSPVLSYSAPLCHHFGDTVGAGVTQWIICDKPVYGRYLFIQQLGTEYLVLCEVEVYGLLVEAASNNFEAAKEGSSGDNMLSAEYGVLATCFVGIFVYASQQS